MSDDEEVNEIAAVVTVTLYADGYSMVSIDPGTETDHAAVSRAAERLSGIARTLKDNSTPIHCTTCETLVEGIVTEPDGRHVVRPCGHSFA